MSEHRATRSGGRARAIAHWCLVVAAGCLGSGSALAYTVPGDRVEAALASAPSADQRPLQFAVPVALNLGAEDFDWTLDAERAVGELSLHSPGALSLSLRLDATALPATTTLQFVSADGRSRHGRYTAEDFADGSLWTPLVFGEHAVLRVALAAADRSRLGLRVGVLYHGFRDFLAPVTAKDLGDSGDCNVDVACPAGNAWRDDARSVARLQIGGTGLCSGVLVNNLRQDLRPYVLTADHCGVGTGAGDSPASSVVFYWNLRNAQCGGDSRDADVSQTTNGSRFVADDPRSDFTLLELAQNPPPTYNLYFAGVDANGARPSNGVSIHHPSGDTQKISFYSGPATASQADIGGGRVVEAWRVTWDQGTTEPGSSGAGLWDANHRVVGLLSGGNASCSAAGAPDFFGRLDQAWEAESAASGQLKVHLDPDATCQRAIDGRNASSGPGTATAGTACAAAADSDHSAAGGALSLLALGGLLLARRRHR